jgi:RecA-family ATPase
MNSTLPPARGKARKPGASARPDEDLLSGIHNGTWLGKQDFPELRYAVPGIVPEGLTVLAGTPKVGKSFLVLSWLLAVAAPNGCTLGGIWIRGARPVFYLALEDGDRRMQDRCQGMLGAGQAIPAKFEYLTEVAPGRVPATVAVWLALERNRLGMVVIDTLGKVNGPAARGETAYDRDYRVMSELKAVVDRHPGAALLINHHDRKASAADFVEAVSGTNAITGSADTVIVLKRQRNQPEGLMEVTGRDVEGGSYAVHFKGGIWELDGGSLETAKAGAEERRAGQGLADRSREIIAYVSARPLGVRPPELAAALRIEKNTATTCLARLVNEGRLRRPSRGLYTTLL